MWIWGRKKETESRVILKHKKLHRPHEGVEEEEEEGLSLLGMYKS